LQTWHRPPARTQSFNRSGSGILRRFVILTPPLVVVGKRRTVMESAEDTPELQPCHCGGPLPELLRLFRDAVRKLEKLREIAK
jgi:hypothetical protein